MANPPANPAAAVPPLPPPAVVPSSSAPRMLMASPMAHRDVPDAVLSSLDGRTSEQVSQGFAPLLGLSGAASGSVRVGPLIAGLFHVLAEVGVEVGRWASRRGGPPIHELQQLLDLVGLPAIWESIHREVGLAETAA